MNWHGKRYYSFDSFLKNYFGEKIYKVSLDGGFTCPNRDGTLGTGGCIFCSEGGSGDFASSAALSVTDQITAGIEMVSRKIENGKYIAYFQAFTNTYGPIEKLEALYMEAVNDPRIIEHIKGMFLIMISQIRILQNMQHRKFNPMNRKVIQITN